VVIGVGLNVNSRLEQFDPEVQPLVTTLFEQTGQAMELSPLLDALLQAITSCVKRLSVEREGVLEEWQRYDMLRGQPVTYTTHNRIIEGVGLGITQDGLYRIHDDTNHEHTVVGGQLRMRNQ
jgi:BirA family biotin operon repressor/biotin-[acetyl-CoA-carboxylase] ligase